MVAMTCRGQTLAERTEPQPDESHHAPVGVLGYPLGSYLTVGGVRTEQGPGPGWSLIVDTVSGHKFAKPVTTYVNLKLPVGRCIFNGYEKGAWGGDLPPEVDQYEKYDGPRPQFGWGFVNTFVITSVVQPADFRPSSQRQSAP